MKLRPRQFLRCFWDAAVTMIYRHDGIEHAGYLAFLGLLALFPFLVFIVAVIGLIGQGAAGATFITTLLLNLPHDIADALKPRVVEIVSGPPQGLLTVSILGAIWTSSSAVEGLRTVLNRAYQVHTPPAYWLRRLLSIAELLMFAFISIAAMLLVVLVPLALRHLGDWLGIHLTDEHRQYWSNLIYPLTVFVLFAVVAGLYYAIPNIRQRFISVAPGAALVVVGWIGAAWLFTLYLSNFHQVSLIYGSLGGFIASLLFFYICNIVLIYGAEFNYQLMHALGLNIVERE